MVRYGRMQLPKRIPGGQTMKRFQKRFADRIVGILAGFDRMLFNAVPGFIRYTGGLEKFLSANHIPYSELDQFYQKLTDRIVAHGKRLAEERGRPHLFLQSPKEDKRELAELIRKRDHVEKGLICVFASVEPCMTFGIRKDERGKPRWKSVLRKCTHLYFYFLDREFGLMYIRLQTWLPFRVEVGVNGREWLERRLIRAGIGYQKEANCFPSIEDLPRAQQLFDGLLDRDWPDLLNAWARRVNPWLQQDSEYDLGALRWCLRDGEYATDVVFRDKQSLQSVYPAMVRHAIDHFQTLDILRFLARKADGRARASVRSRMLEFGEGIRIKHWVDENSIKMYNKAGNLLRVETTISQPKRFKTRRWVTHHGQRVLNWAAMRKGVVDLRRRAEVSRAANKRYLEALAVVQDPCPRSRLLDPVSRPVVRAGRRNRALRPISPEDSQKLQLIHRGELLIRGFRNRDLLPDWPEGKGLTRIKISGRITRWLRLLRAHRLIYRVPGTHDYRITKKGHQVTTAALDVRKEDTRVAA
jgi:hypothetical protein